MSLVEPEIIPTPVLGDANSYGRISICDVTAIQRKLAKYDVPDLNELAADIDGSGLNVNDATLIQKYLAEIDTEYTIGEKVE